MKWSADDSAIDFGLGQGLNAVGILCVFQGIQNAGISQKIRGSAAKHFGEFAHIKRGRGEMHSPRLDSHFAFQRWPAYNSTTRFGLSRQDLAAFGTAAGKNLAAVGSSHSLPETMNLGTMTTAGLVGTLHLWTPP